MSKEIVKIKLDFNQGPIWISDAETGQPITGTPPKYTKNIGANVPPINK